MGIKSSEFEKILCIRTVILLTGRLVLLKLIYFSYPFCGYFSGFYCPLGSAYPQPCEAGSYCNQTGLDAPAGPCAAGYYCPKGSLDLHTMPCPIGHYCPLGTPLPLPCPLGTIKREILFFCNITAKDLSNNHIYSWNFVNNLIIKRKLCATCYLFL